MKAVGIRFKASAGATENSPGKIQDLFPVLSGIKVSILSNEIAYGLKNSYAMSTKGWGFFFAVFFFPICSNQKSNWQAW